MTFDQIILLLVGTISVVYLIIRSIEYFKNLVILNYFRDLKCYDEKSAKNMNEILKQPNQDIKLMPYVKLFKNKIIGITSDQRLYMNMAVYRRQMIRNTIHFGILWMILLVTIGLAIWQ